MIAAVNAPCFVSVEELQVRFLGILGRIEQHARIAFRHVTCREKRADLIAGRRALARADGITGHRPVSPSWRVGV
jgi:hypothetical protein